MTHRAEDGTVMIAVEPPRKCSACRRERECRPYGKGGADVCFECAMATEESRSEADRQFRSQVLDDA